MHEAKQLHQAISGQSRIYLPRMLSSIAVTNEVRDTGVPRQHVFKLCSHACRKRCPTEWEQLSRLTPCRRRHWERGGEKFRGKGCKSAQNRSARGRLMTYMPLRRVTIDLGNLCGQIFSRTEFAPSARSRACAGTACRAPRRRLKIGGKETAPRKWNERGR